MKPLSKPEGNKIVCLLCPHFCSLVAGRTGICGVRKNTGAAIELLTYGVISGYSVDPVEKKPLYHFFPGKKILSVGSYGCNMRCDFCQNFNISQSGPPEKGRKITSPELCLAALNEDNNIGLAFTYNEPIIWYEFIRDTAPLIREKGLYTVLVSNGFINPEPLAELTGFIDAFNIDLKAFNADFYKRITGSRLEPVKESLKIISGSGRHLEITTLIIPGLNDSENEMRQECEWISSELGNEVPLHLSRYYPMNRRTDPSTSAESLRNLFKIATEYLKYVYIGNISSETGQNTICPSCGKTVTLRTGYSVTVLNIDESGSCDGCGKQIYRYFTLNRL